MMQTVQGIAASDGIAIAKAYLLIQPDLSFAVKTISDTEIDQEIARLNQALDISKTELSKIREKTAEKLGEEEAGVFDAHLMVLSDPEMISAIEEMIRQDKVNAEQALTAVTNNFIMIFESMEDNPYMQERAADIRDVTKRVLSHLLGIQLPDPSMINEEVIIIAHDLTPSDTAQLDKRYVQAFVTNIGGRTSHSAIMARSLEIPAVVGTKDITQCVTQGMMLAVNGMTGEVILNPDDALIATFKEKQAQFAEEKEMLQKMKNELSYTADGKQVELVANIGTPKDLDAVIHNGGEGIGLYRTEFLYMDNTDFPTEEEQFEAYKVVLESMDGKPVVVRTMDIGGDKELPYLPLDHEMNPFLGYRAIRISLDQTEMFRTQLRALLRASVYGDLRIMFPMIATVQEFVKAKEILEEEKTKLIKAGVQVSDSIQVGMMIEIPAAAILADQFAKKVDFFSIGTNDLIQYTMAADRMNERVSYLYQPYNPSVLRLINMVIQAAHKEGKWVGMCGEMAGETTAVPLLLGMGLDEFSMSATSILKVRYLLSKLSYQEMQQLAEKALTECSNSEEVIALIHKHVPYL